MKKLNRSAAIEYLGGFKKNIEYLHVDLIINKFIDFYKSEELKKRKVKTIMAALLRHEDKNNKILLKEKTEFLIRENKKQFILFLFFISYFQSEKEECFKYFKKIVNKKHDLYEEKMLLVKFFSEGENFSDIIIDYLKDYDLSFFMKKKLIKYAIKFNKINADKEMFENIIKELGTTTQILLKEIRNNDPNFHLSENINFKNNTLIRIVLKNIVLREIYNYGTFSKAEQVGKIIVKISEK